MWSILGPRSLHYCDADSCTLARRRRRRFAEAISPMPFRGRLENSHNHRLIAWTSPVVSRHPLQYQLSTLRDSNLAEYCSAAAHLASSASRHVRQRGGVSKLGWAASKSDHVRLSSRVLYFNHAEARLIPFSFPSARGRSASFKTCGNACLLGSENSRYRSRAFSWYCTSLDHSREEVSRLGVFEIAHWEGVLLGSLCMQAAGDGSALVMGSQLRWFIGGFGSGGTRLATRVMYDTRWGILVWS